MLKAFLSVMDALEFAVFQASPPDEPELPEELIVDIAVLCFRKNGKDLGITRDVGHKMPGGVPPPISVSKRSAPAGRVLPVSLPTELAAGAVVVDLRSAEERADGYLTCSVAVPYGEWEQAAAAIMSDAPHIILHCMYSGQRAPNAADIALERDPSCTVSILEGGFQQCMAQLWGREGYEELFTGVRSDRWIEHGAQGLVWAPDVLTTDAAAEVLASKLAVLAQQRSEEQAQAEV